MTEQDIRQYAERMRKHFEFQLKPSANLEQVEADLRAYIAASLHQHEFDLEAAGWIQPHVEGR